MAQEQMARMTPEQMAEMQKMAAKMDPSVAAKMGLNPAQLRQASEAMQNMSSDEFAKASEQARPSALPRHLRTCVRGTDPATARADEEHEPGGLEAAAGGGNVSVLGAAAVLLQRACDTRRRLVAFGVLRLDARAALRSPHAGVRDAEDARQRACQVRLPAAPLPQTAARRV